MAIAEKGRGPGGLLRALLLAISGLLLTPGTAEAYIGPGAGFALLSSFLVLFTTIVLAAAFLLIWPFRALWRLTRRRARLEPWIKRLIVVGFDGQDPKLTEQFMTRGLLPNFERLQQMGC